MNFSGQTSFQGKERNFDEMALAIANLEPFKMYFIPQSNKIAQFLFGDKFVPPRSHNEEDFMKAFKKFWDLGPDEMTFDKVMRDLWVGGTHARIHWYMITHPPLHFSSDEGRDK